MTREGPITRFAVLITKSASFSQCTYRRDCTYLHINASHVCPAKRYVHNMNAICPCNMLVDDSIRMDERRKRGTDESERNNSRSKIELSSSDNGARKTGRMRNDVSLMQSREQIYGNYRV